MAQDTSSQIRLALSRQCATLGVPVSGIFELTPRCNLQCKMCYVRLTPEQMAPLGTELTAGQWLSLAQQAKDAGMLFLLLTGGEPTLRKDFCEIYQGLAQMGFSLTVNTNATMLSPAIRALWHDYPPSMVSVTLYGTCREDYYALCGNANAFDSVVEALQWLRQEGILIHLNTTMAPNNAQRWLELELFAESMGLDLRMTTYCFPPVRRTAACPNAEFSRLPPEEAAELICKDLLHQRGSDYVKLIGATLSSPPQMECPGIGETIQCMAGRAQFWMAWDGGMTPCGMLPQPRVLPVRDRFDKAWQELLSQTAAIRLCPECVTCPDKDTCMNCAAVTFTETGRFDGKPEYMCRLNRSYRHKIKEISNT